MQNLWNKMVGNQLLKNYEIEKDPHLQAGVNRVWNVYRAKKKDRNNMDVSLFVLEKKLIPNQSHKEDIGLLLKKDPNNLMKLKHPNLLGVIEQPQEDNKKIYFVTEPVEYSLSSLLLDESKRELIPSELEIKCMIIDLFEGLQFLNQTAKTIHCNISPENIFVTKEGRVKLGGLNFSQQFSTYEELPFHINYDLKIIPNLRFSAPELSKQQVCTVQSDLFSVGCIIYFLLALSKNKMPFLLSQQDIIDISSHKFECDRLPKRLPQLLIGFETAEELIRQLIILDDPKLRGQIVQLLDKPYFHDPLLKAIRYLETLDQKEQSNKVQFLNGILKILDKFDRKTLIKKVVPLLLDQMKIPQLSINILPSILFVMEKPNFLTTSEFRQFIWPSIIKLCKAKELPAQSLYLLLKNTELFLKFVGQNEFQTNFLPLLLKSLECGVPKLQFLALTKIPSTLKQIDYQLVKTSLLPRMLCLLQKDISLQIKQKTLETINDMITTIDQHTMKDTLLKSLEKIRQNESDPILCMLLLKIYEQMAKVLGPEDIGLKILPGMIPMLISGSFTKEQFKDLIGSIRKLLDQIESHRIKDLREENPIAQSDNKLFDIDMIDTKKDVQQSDDVYAFLNSLNIDTDSNKQKPSNDIFNIISSQQQQTQKQGGWDNDMPNLLDLNKQQNQLKQEKDVFNSQQQLPNFNQNIGSQININQQSNINQQVNINQQNKFNQNQQNVFNQNFNQINFNQPQSNLNKLNEDPFAELMSGIDNTKQSQPNLQPQFGFGQNLQLNPQQQQMFNQQQNIGQFNQQFVPQINNQNQNTQNNNQFINPWQ